MSYISIGYHTNWIVNLLLWRTGLKFTILDIRQLDVQQQIVELERAAYGGANIGDRVEGASYFDHYTRGQQVTEEVHFGLYFQDELIAYYAVLGVELALFEKSRAALESNPQLPIYVFTKLMRHPQRGVLLRQTNALRNHLSLFIGLLARSTGGFYLETRGQLDTRLLLRKGGPADVVFPGILRLVDTQDSDAKETENVPYILLYMFPQISLFGIYSGIRRLIQRSKKK